LVKAFVSVDMEGIRGLVHSDHISRDGKDYELERRPMTLEANAAIGVARRLKLDKLPYAVIDFPRSPEVGEFTD